MNDPTRVWLQEVASPQLYRRNAFRITGVATGADRREVRRRQQKVTTALELGADVDLGHRLPVTPDEVARAFDLILGDPRRRLIDELFWLWGAPDACGCPEELHELHDRTVRAHAAALDAELSGDASEDDLDEKWDEAGDGWEELLEHPGLWEHVRARIRALDDRQLDESVLDLLREQVPVVLLTPLVQLAALADRPERLVLEAETWPAPDEVIGDLLEEAARPRFDTARTALARAREHLMAGEFDQAVSVLREEVLPDVRWLDKLLPTANGPLDRLQDEVAVIFNNCAMALLDREGPQAAERARDWLHEARRLVTDPATMGTVGENFAVLDAMESGLANLTAQVDLLQLQGRHSTARKMLRRVRRDLRGAPGTAEIDALLERVNRRDRWRWTRVAAVVVFLALGAFLGWVSSDHGSSGSDTGSGSDTSSATTSTTEAGPSYAYLFGTTVADNAPAGSCVVDKIYPSAATSPVRIVPCDQPHWGEVLDYVSLGAVPSPYPGDDAVQAGATTNCAFSQAKQRLSFDTYRTEALYPDHTEWNTGQSRFQNYVTCVVHLADDRFLPDRRLTDPARVQDTDIVLNADLYGPQVATNPPAGTCVQDKANFQADVHNVRIVPCQASHWGQLLGYPMLFPEGTAYPGDDAVRTAADQVCRLQMPQWGYNGDAFRYYALPPGPERWNGPSPKGGYFTGCVASWADDHSVTTGYLNK
ncbi:hypothetical protein FNH05_03390 [Amycolatopsis rhizosphaerae]|uniref:Septum formation-related domain-containing protein n=1 Tax=Amycolatopsis rhizosphaerae TaxID=2053003 RepID=A0A558DJQ5_9PSEU|nr:septum formation family protein [Amycolatopsis rhizosphaerae]TVT61213.1 hypothetical protein FNH05_03390 [Amycolatopsis rhizosphaerae]